MSIPPILIIIILICFASGYYFYKSLKSGYDLHALLGLFFSIIISITVFFIILGDLFPGY